MSVNGSNAVKLSLRAAHMVRLHPLNGPAPKLLDRLPDLLRNLRSNRSRLQQPNRRLCAREGSLDRVGCRSRGRLRLVCSNDDGLCCNCGETVNVCSKLDLDDVAVLELGLV